MTVQKKEPAQPGGSASAGTATTESSSSKRKPWIKRTPVEIILEQVEKQEQKVADLRKELAKEEAELKKMQDATKLLSAK
jgi:hypothetical protein